jgi:nickel-dependent lactate racemase
LTDCWLPYGETEVYVSVDLDNLLKILGPPDGEERIMLQDEVLRAIDVPVGAASLDELVEPDCRVAIAVDGSMSPGHAVQVLSHLVKQLVEQIVPRDRITVVLGDCERENGGGRLLGEIGGAPALSQVQVVDHVRSTGGLVEAGVTHRGTPVSVNRAYAEATVRIAVGEARVDPLYGFRGAHNAVVPGVCSHQTLVENRRNYFRGGAAPGVLELNPVKEDVVEAVRLAGVDFAVNVAVSPGGEALGVYAGGFEETWGRAVTALGGGYEARVDALSDVTVVSAGGERFDFNLYKAAWALEGASRVTKRNGAVILLAECGEGLGAEAFTRLARVTEASEFERRYMCGAEALQMFRRVTRTQRVILVSALPSYLVEPLGFESARTVNQAYEMAVAGRRGRGTYVMPYGSAFKVYV